MTIKRVELLVFGGCPHADTALEHVRAALREVDVDADVQIIHVEREEDAERLRFLGSPTVRVDGVDVEQVAAGRRDFGLQCRVYDVDGRVEGAPPTEWIVAALRTR